MTTTLPDTQKPPPTDEDLLHWLRQITLEVLKQSPPDPARLKVILPLYFKSRQLDLAERKFQIQLERHRASLLVLQEKLGAAGGVGNETSDEASRVILDKLDEILGLQPSHPAGAPTSFAVGKGHDQT